MLDTFAYYEITYAALVCCLILQLAKLLVSCSFGNHIECVVIIIYLKLKKSCQVTLNI